MKGERRGAKSVGTNYMFSRTKTDVETNCDSSKNDSSKNANNGVI